MRGSNSELGSNNQHVKISNRALVLKLICTQANVSRINISRLTGLSKMSITNIVNEWIQEGYVVEQTSFSEALDSGSSGRKPICLEPKLHDHFVIGLYISRDYAVATLSNLKCEVVYEKKGSFSFDESGTTFVEKLKGLVAEILQSDVAKDKNILGLGVASIGPLDLKNGIILDPPNFRELKSIQIKRILEEAFHLKVFLDNDMNASALAEKLFGNATRIRNFIYLGVTNGIGSGIVANDLLFEGDRGFGGEIGHVSIDFNGPRCACGNNGCLELYASIPEIVTLARDAVSLEMESSLSAIEKIDWENIVESAKSGDKLALHVIDRMCLYISFAIISLSNIFDPEIIYLGHDIALAGKLVTDRISAIIQGKTISSRYKNIPIEISAFIEKAPILGASAIVLDKLFNGLL